MDLQKQLKMSNAEFTDFTNSVANILKDNFLIKIIKHEMTLEEGISASLAHLNNANDIIMRNGVRRHLMIADAMLDTVYEAFNR